MDKQQIKTLTKLLLDNNAEFGDRDDAAMLLAEFNDPEIEEVLVKVASDESRDSDLAETCGESLGEIWARKSSFNPNNFHKLKGRPLLLALEIVETRKPQWKEYTSLIKKLKQSK